jgi:hypothetical protein
VPRKVNQRLHPVFDLLNAAVVVGHSFVIVSGSVSLQNDEFWLLLSSALDL